MGFFSKKRKVNQCEKDFSNMVEFIERQEEEKWERRRFELVKQLVCQDRRSVVLGKLKASPATIAKRATELADVTIRELRKTENYEKEGI